MRRRPSATRSRRLDLRHQALAPLGAAALVLVATAGCNMVAFTADTTADVLEVAAPALNQESDVELARAAAPAQLKTVEGFYLASPDNRKLIRILAQGYCEYAFGFLESDIEELRLAGKDDEADHLGKRATGLYLRCVNYGLKLLGSSWEKALYADQATFDAQVKAARKADVPGMFFVALGIGGAVNLNRDDIDMITYLTRAQALFERIIALDERFYNGGAHMALGLMQCARAKAVGGNPPAGRAHLGRAIQLTGGKFLLPKVLMGFHCGVVEGDVAFFRKHLTEVLATSPAIFPEQRLANELAHLRARRYLAHEKEWF